MAFLQCRLILLSVAIAMSTGCMSGIELVGIDKEGEKILKVPPDEYVEKMGESLAEVYDSALYASESFSQGNQRFYLKTFMVGVGIEGKVGVADIVTLGASSRIRLLFSKNSYGKELR